MAMDHGMWLNLKKEDLKRAYDNGTFPKEGWRSEHAPIILKDLTLLKHALWKSFLVTSLIAIIVAVLGLYFGGLNLQSTINIAKATSFAGGCIAAWGAIFQLTWPGIETYSKKSLNEMVQKSVFFMLFVLGVFISLSGLVL
jgi:hypothetical protein